MKKGKRVPSRGSAVALQGTIPHLDDLLWRGMVRNAADLIENERTWPDCPQRAEMVHRLREIACTGKVPRARGRAPRDLCLVKENVAFEVDRQRRRGKTLADAFADFAQECSAHIGRTIQPEHIATLYGRGVRAAKKRAEKKRDIFAGCRVRKNTKSPRIRNSTR